MSDEPTTVSGMLEQLLPCERERYSAPRWPYTYSADLVRQRPTVVPENVRNAFIESLGVPGTMIDNLSRVHAARLRRSWAAYESCDDEELAQVLADVYLLYYDVSVPDDVAERLSNVT